MRALRPVLGLVVVVLLFAVTPAGAANSVTYQDSTGEDPTGPDITTVVVSNDDTGKLTFRVNIPNRPQYATDIAIDIFVNTDDNATTGSAELLGADYVIELFRGEVSLFRWDGTTFTRRPGDPPATSLIYSWSGGVTVTISAKELGNTKKFGFGVLAITGLVIDDVTGDIDDTNAKSDVAPPFSAGFYQYDVKLAPVRVVFKSLSTAPVKPKAGKTFTVRMAATRSDTGAPIVNGQVDCVARAGTKNVAPKSERFAAGRATCVFTVPAGTTGKTLRGTITMIFEGKRLTRPFSGKIG